MNIFIIVRTRVEKNALTEYLKPRLMKTSASVSLFSPIIVKATQGSSTSLYSTISVSSTGTTNGS